MPTIRPAKEEDFKQIFGLALKFDLDSEDMRAEDFIVAEDKKKIVSIGRIKDHPDCQELCSLGVDENYRKQGIGQMLVKALIKKSSRELYLTTIIPDFFKPFGFDIVKQYPKSMVKKEEWCEGCKDRARCTVMKYGQTSKIS